MPFTNIGQEGAPFNVKAPDFNENADIRTAIRTYHYGEGQSGSQPLDSSSIAGYLQLLTQSKVSGEPIPLGANANLNNITTSGFYIQTSDANARTGSGYPTFNPAEQDSLQRAGLLRVIADPSGNVFQEYYSATPIAENRHYWRSKIGINNFSQWKASAELNHLHDDRYVLLRDIDALFVSQIKYKTIKSVSLSQQNSVYTLQKSDEDSILLVNSGSFPNTIAIPQDVIGSPTNIVVGSSFKIIQANTGKTTVLPNTTNVTLNATPGNSLREIWSVVTLTKIATNVWSLSGDLEDNKTNTQRKATVGIYVQQNEPTAGVQDGDLWFW
jgi:hypothetical protein